MWCRCSLWQLFLRATRWRIPVRARGNAADSESNTRAVDSLLNYETVKYFNNETFEAERYDASLDVWEQARRKNRLSPFALNGGQALIIATAQPDKGMAAVSVNQSTMTLGDFILVNQFMLQLFMPLGFRALCIARSRRYGQYRAALWRTRRNPYTSARTIDKPLR